MATIEQRILTLFTPLPLSLKTKVLALLSQLVAKEAEEEETLYLDEDLATSIEVRNRVAKKEMQLHSEETYWDQLRRRGQAH